MSSRRDQHQNSYGPPSSYNNDDPNGGHRPPPLRQPNLSSAQVLAAVKLGFSDKHSNNHHNNYSAGNGGSNGRGGGRNSYSNDTSGFPEIGQFSAEDYVEPVQEEVQAQRRPNNSYNQHDDRHTGQYFDQGQGDEGEGLLPPLRRPHTHEIPADVLAVLLKEKSCEEMLGQPPPPRNQNPQQLNEQYYAPPTNDRRNDHHASPSSIPPTQPPQLQSQTPGRNNNNVYYQSPNSTPLNRHPHPGHQQSPSQAPQQRVPGPRPHHQQTPPGSSPGQRFDMLQQQQSSPRANYNNSSRPVSSTPTTSTSSAGRQSSVRVQLSANAKEFVPSSPSPSQNQYSGGGEESWTTQEESELAQAVAQFQLHDLQQGQGQPDLIDFNQGAYAVPPSYGDNIEDTSDYVLSTITDSIMDLTNHPANFARVAKGVTEVLTNFCFDLDTLNVVVTLLVEQSISNPNFCYSGARLAEALVKNKIAVNGTTFKKILLVRCQEEFVACKAKMESDPASMIRFRGLLMYFAELWMNIKVKDVNTGVDMPIVVLGLGVLETMQNLVKDKSHDNIKCVFQVLKLVGWDLENSTDPRMVTNFEQLLKDMSFLCMASDSIEPQTKFLLDTLFELKNKKWNREDPSTQAPSPATSAASSGHTGVPNIYELPDSDDDYDDDDCILIDDESEEVQRAYEEFLNSTM